MKIGIVGAGKIGGLIGTLWSRAGHEVMFASRHPKSLADLVEAAGGGATSGTADQAIAFGDVILLSIPFKELPKFGPAKHDAFGRKVVLETGNPTLSRDGALAEEVMGSGRGTGAYLREWLQASVSCARSTPYGTRSSPAKRTGRSRASVSRSRRTTKKRCRSPLRSSLMRGSIPSSWGPLTARENSTVGLRSMTPACRAPRSVRLWASPRAERALALLRARSATSTTIRGSCL